MGIFVFSSASLGILAKSEAKFYSIIFNQIVLGLTLGIFSLVFFSKFNYRFFRKYSFIIFVFAVIITALVFVSGLGFEHNGARRWIEVGSFSFQPSEFLKIGFVIYFAALLALAKEKVRTFRYGVLPFLVLIGVCGVLLIKQPDTGTFMVIFAAGLAMLLVSGTKLRNIAVLGLMSIVGIALLSLVKPYLKARIMTYFDPGADPLGASYQIQQSLIAIGSGEIFGRGFGQSIQKFNFLPEPVGDSIFAVMSEEFGFIGALTLLSLFLIFAFRGLKIASMASDQFGRLLATGLVILIVFQSLINIGSMIGILPLVGVPIAFVSHGGTALLFALTEVGIILNISKNKLN
mgnify:FL=1